MIDPAEYGSPYDHPIPAERLVDPTPQPFNVAAFLAATRPPWMADAACTDHPTPEIFFPEPGAGKDVAAKAVCATCPVLEECGAYAMVHAPDGVWGGMNANERSRLRPSGRPGGSPHPGNHGTVNGYEAHRRRKEQACEDCLAAKRRHSADEKAARRIARQAVAS